MKRGRGRPSKNQSTSKELKLEEIIDLALREKGEPVTYVSVLKGGMAVLFEGHHFKPFVKRNRCMFYRCLRYDLKKCPGRVMVHQSLVYPVDLAHNHDDYALMEQHGAVVPSAQAASLNQEPRNLNAEMKIQPESVYEIITLPAAPQVINSADNLKPKINDIIILPESTEQKRNVPEIKLPSDITIKKISEKQKSTGRVATRSHSGITILSNETVVPSSGELSSQDNLTSEEDDGKSKLEVLTSDNLRQKMKDRLKMALLKAKK